MAVRNMIRSDLHQPDTAKGALYHEDITLTAGSVSDTIIFPISEVYSITAKIDGDGAIEFSNDSFDKLYAETAIFVPWNGVGEINIGIIAFRVTRNSGTVTAVVSAKTASV